MSDIINQLSQASRSSSILDSIANPAVVNPLAAYQGAAQAANTVFGVREKQAQQAIGDILQQSTDANGNVDYQRAHSLAAQAGPVVQMGMQQMLLRTSLLRGQQLEQAQAHSRNIGQASLTILQDPSDANLEMVRQSLIRSGYPADVINKEIDAAKLLSEPDRRKWAYQHGLTAMDAGAAMNRTAGQTTMGQFGGTSAPVTTFQPSPYGPGGAAVGGGIPHAPDPSTYYGPQTTRVGLDANGNEVPANDPSAVRWITKDIPRGPAFGMPPPGSMGSPGSGGGAPAANPAGVPPPGTVPANPNAAPGSTPGRYPATPNNPAARNPAVAQPGVTTSAPTGAEDQVKVEQDTRNKDIADIPNQQSTLENMKHAYDALAFITTGKGQQIPNSLFNTLQGFGLLPEGAVNRLEKYEEYKKYASRRVIEMGLIGGNTDLGRQLAATSNPGDLLSTAANRELHRNDIGKTIQGMAAARAEDPSASPSGYLKRRADLVSRTDPRGFAWPLYSQEEQQKILADAVAADKRNGNTNASDKLHRAIGMAQRLQLDLPFQR